jgi:hypothetical protein
MKHIREQAKVLCAWITRTNSPTCAYPHGRVAKRMERLYGPGLDHDTDDCARRWEVPIRAVSFRKAVATPKRVIADERVAALKAGRARIRGRVPVPVSAVHTNEVFS